ncbi:hypothetical protein K491DRAFT_439997 [Lophiostoma macrostomum CBS 122681]|uniref:Uncharacterized protein n=1 Tax=Lophiostoma macrostomum CBS 122681 TaxID=1314788 RepID=A0A6A6T823_9PLEO|nr:hypothetical protein K491DRAFT_439997 [Lophiostoma macrostomum CBS 122681]
MSIWRFCIKSLWQSLTQLHSTEEDDENSKNRHYRPRHLGYRAVHYRVPMKDSDETKVYDWMENDQVEIQVVSALTHAWAEVGHDIIYKTYAFGEPTLEERRTLDALNGLIQSGDLLLESFQEMVAKRTTLPFQYREQLTVFLRSFFRSERNAGDEDDDLEHAAFPRGEGIYILFKFLEEKGLNTPMKVRHSLKKLRYPYEHHEKEQRIRKSFNPVPTFAPDMSVVVCLIRDLLREKAYKAPSGHKTARDMCAIMMSALTILQYALGGADEAGDYLQKTSMTPAQIDSMNFLLESPKRYATLNGGYPQHVVEDLLQDAWNWFFTSASDPASLCGFFFCLAEMGCMKPVDPNTQISQLNIGPLSTVGTTDVTGEAGAVTPLARASVQSLCYAGSKPSASGT